MSKKENINSIFMKILPEKIFNAAIKNINYKQLNELRLRAGKPIVVILGNQYYFVSEKGITQNIDESIICTQSDIDNIIFRASECSIYAVNEQIKQGFITINSGIRIGIAGTGVCEGEQIKTIKNFTSLVIRIPHNIKNCSLLALKYLFEKGEFKNTLIVSPPGSGKTTFIRDFINQLSERNISLNILLLDERGEISPFCDGENNLVISNFCDVLSFINKPQGFLIGIRSLSPSIIVCDEIGANDDILAIEYAGYCGVGVMATAHAGSINELKNKLNFKSLFDKKLFKRFIVLSSRLGPGTFEGIYDENFVPIKLADIDYSWGCYENYINFNCRY